MEIHYNAFISYRHHPEDIRVASEIHRALEHYRVPKAIRGKTKGIKRIFRDKEELPITSDLSNDITRALQNSDFLIVICSVHTRESTWVQREIETFLKYHDRNRVLTVLVNGEPYETIPEILLSEEKVDPQTGEVKMVPIEPLSCDWRIPRRQARREELPRLAAALMGCGYDELRQRERQYRTRRLVAIFSTALAASLCLSAYFIYTSLQIQRANERLVDANAEIRANLEQALENQSLFLANESHQLLEDGDRLAALALALEALPEFEGQRPYVPNAEMALATALGAYESEGTVAAVGAMDCGALVKEFVVTEDGQTVYIRDARNVITVWDVGTLEQTGVLRLDFEPASMAVCGSGDLLIHDAWAERLICCGRDGSVLWSAATVGEYALSENGNTVFVLNYKRDSLREPCTCTIDQLDSNSGDPIRESLSFEGPGGHDGVPRFLMERIPDGAPVVVYFSGKDEGYKKDLLDVMAVDMETGEAYSVMSMEEALIECGGFTADGDLLLMCREKTDSLRGFVLDMVTTCELRGTLYCLDWHTGETKWQTEITSYMPGPCWILETIPGGTDLFFLYENAFHVIDSTTGEILVRGESGKTPLWAKVGGDRVYVVLEDGSSGAFYYDSGECSTIPYMLDDLSYAHRWDTTYFVSQNLGSQVVVYKWLKDTNCQTYVADVDYLSVEGYDAAGDLVAFEEYGKLWVMDTAPRKLLWTNENAQEYSSNVTLLGFDTAGETIWGFSHNKLLIFDAPTGEVRAMQLPDMINGMNLNYLRQGLVCGDQFYALAKRYEDNGQILLRMDTKEGVVQNWFICMPEETDIGLRQTTVLLGATERYVLLWENTTRKVMELDTYTGTVGIVAENVEIRPVAESFGDGEFALAAGHEIQLCRFGGGVTGVVDLGEKKAGGILVHGEEIFAVCDDGGLYRYDTEGNLLSHTELYRYTSFYDKLASDPARLRWWFTEDGDLILDACGIGNIIDRGTWQLRAAVPSFVAYDPVGDLILVNSPQSQSYGLACYPRYTTGDVMDMARDALGSFRLDEDRRADYGLSED